MKKIDWNEFKEQVINGLKFILFTIVMLMGFFVIYGIAYLGLRLPQTNLGMWFIFALSLFSEWLFFKWLSV